jgi:hypothetical protein
VRVRPEGLWQYVKPSPDEPGVWLVAEPRPDDRAGPWQPPHDPRREFEGFAASLKAPIEGPFYRTQPDEADRELMRLYRDSPALLEAERKRMGRRDPAAPLEGDLIAIGTLRIDRWFGELGVPDPRGCLLRFVAGDLGEFGRIADIKVSDLARACPAAGTSPERSKMALETGRGIIHGVYVIPHLNHRRGATYIIKTLLQPGLPNQTAVKWEH